MISLRMRSVFLQASRIKIQVAASGCFEMADAIPIRPFR